MKGIIILLLLLTSCAHSDYDINPWATVFKQLVKGTYEVE